VNARGGHAQAAFAALNMGSNTVIRCPRGLRVVAGQFARTSLIQT
jgi:hypothetical protein